MLDRLALGFSRAADTAEYLLTDHFPFTFAVIALPILAVYAAVFTA